MPLFYLVSGYVANYSQPIQTGQELIRKICKRTIAYLLPWFSWSFLIRGLVFQQKTFLDVCHLLWHMDSGYWFLISIWMINILFFVSQFFAGRCIVKCAFTSALLELIFFGLSMVALAAVGAGVGMTFLAIKQTLYYMPFYFAGYLYGKMQTKLLSDHIGKQLVEVVIPIAFFLWLSMIKRFNMFYVSDNGIGIIIRAVTSLSGCIGVSGLAVNCANKFKFLKWIGEVGKNSIGIYTIHYLFLCMFNLNPKPMVGMLQGILIVVLNYCVTVVLACVGTAVIQQNRWLRLILLGQRDK